MYTRREGPIGIFPELLKTQITVLKAQSNIVSHRKSKDTKVLEDLRQIHPSVELEARLLSTIWRNRDDLTRLQTKERGEDQNRQGGGTRAEASGEAQEEEEEEVEERA